MNTSKSTFLYTILFLCLAFSFPIFSSAIIICKVQAKVIKQIPNNTDDPDHHILKIIVLSSKFDSGHSAGTKCEPPYLNFEEKITFHSKTKRIFKPNQIIEIYHQTVYNISASGRNIHKSWYFKNDN